jgi:hypothetical protein
MLAKPVIGHLAVPDTTAPLGHTKYLPPVHDGPSLRTPDSILQITHSLHCNRSLTRRNIRE